jgi:hypothetical protein
MDLDSFQSEFYAFRGRVMPMLVAWEAHGGAVSPVDKETADALNAEIYKPLPPKDASDPTVRQVVVPGAAPPAVRPDPTVQEWVAAGYPASKYATRFPNGPSSAEDIAAAVAAEQSTPLMPIATGTVQMPSPNAPAPGAPPTSAT